MRPHRNDRYLTPIARRVWNWLPEWRTELLTDYETKHGLFSNDKLVLGAIVQPDYYPWPPFNLHCWLVFVRIPFKRRLIKFQVPGDPVSL